MVEFCAASETINATIDIFIHFTALNRFYM